ncbi:TraG-family bacterial conjugation protein [Acidipropionibacterium acidipropionici ATCC 4875]|uniref:TraG-family bacterial conjugation protein n=1 Tax=Acidipropionibacterium acidipropionici (strain ATCC 4875 / DSM 20272 / JCM 6432 / NBRC 12425 / NCIMB 8070 / 4) TaxID=1171373 RepID=K7S3W5_ACIA4|nr:TraM recognition domain-containing protein [Acidipropionibacterium acidipropionici]AFV89282.1 TraG-family bacterial conjugation protein [Acidipropionibacterium acidipropionici ATCC 4875]
MVRASNRRRQPGTAGEAAAIWVVIGAVVLLITSVWAGLMFQRARSGIPMPEASDPFALVAAVLKRQVPWTTSAWVGAGLVIAALVVVAAGIWWLVAGRRGRGSRVDRSAAVMGRGREIEPLTQKHAEHVAKRLGVDGAPGVPVGRAVASGKMLWGTWEDMHIDIWGPRTGKTTSRAIPAILDAPGACLVTSNKRDVVDATRDVRQEAGPVWVFDPQRIALEEPTWWWDPLSFVTDEVKAEELAEHFAAANTGQGAKTDVHFESNGEDLLADCLLAGALDHRPITDVYVWLTMPGDPEPVQILRQHDYELKAAQLEGITLTPDKERGSIYSTARRMAGCLTNRSVTEWITPTVAGRPHFDPAALVASGGTLYSLSKEGKGSAGPLVMALTAAVVAAGEEQAAAAGGRLPVPLVGVLDEAANVCRWRQLPELYSHFGSKGIVLMTILQSWSQGVDVWGESGMKKLWSAANVAVYGGGVKESGFLQDLVRLVGEYDARSVSVSTGRGQHSTSSQLHREQILTVDELAALPRGRAIVLASGARPTLIRTVPWMTSPHAGAVRASIAAHDPSAATPERSPR